MVNTPRVQVFLIAEPARQGTEHVGYRPKATVRVWGSGDVTEYRLDGPTTVFATKAEANATMRPLVYRYLQEKGWEHAEIVEANDPVVDGRPAH